MGSPASAISVGLLAIALPASASARIIELGATKTPIVAPTCPTTVKPTACTIVLTRVTGLETISDGVKYPTTVTRAGRIVAFTLGLSRLSSNNSTARKDIHFLDFTYGGTTQAAITVLKPKGAARLHRWVVVADSPIVHLQPYLGQVVQFPLDKSIPVKRGWVIALSVPTWAAVLAINLAPKQFAYRQSRSTKCSSPGSTEFVQLTIGANTRYGCNYTGTRVEYTVTEVTTPVPPKNQIHAGDSNR